MTTQATLRVLDADPDLAVGLAPEAWAEARRHALARVETLDLGDGPVARAPRSPGDLGLLLIDGLLLREFGLDGRRCCELYGAGDLLVPTDLEADERSPSPWRILEQVRVAILDEGFVVRISRWPAICSALAGRAGQRSRWLALQLLACQTTRVDERLLLLFWFFAERWGRVRSEGTEVPIRLTHETLGRLIGAQRPSVTIAVKELRERDLLSRRRSGSWLLHDHPDAFDDLLERNGRARARGADESLALVPPAV